MWPSHTHGTGCQLCARQLERHASDSGRGEEKPCARQGGGRQQRMHHKPVGHRALGGRERLRAWSRNMAMGSMRRSTWLKR